MDVPIVVLTPVKNEAWILDRFLSVTSQFADVIVIADQGSTDGSLDIYKKYEKVHLVQNLATEFNEASRQVLLIEEARKVVSGPKILLALDTDEMLAANAPLSPEWQTMLSAQPGTVLYFEKPDLYHNMNSVIRYTHLHPIGFVDDGSEHKPDLVHSIRIPLPENHKALRLNKIKILHYGYSRAGSQAAKMRYYSVLENVLSTKNVYRRYQFYGRERIYEKEGILEPLQQAWIEGWEKKGIDMTSVLTQTFFWQDLKVLHFFKKYGLSKFQLDDIWNYDWEACRRYFEKTGEQEIPSFQIPKQNFWQRIRFRGVIRACKFVYYWVGLLRR